MNEYEERLLEQQEAYDAGKREGEEIARGDERKEIAVKMKRKNIPLVEIAEFTGLSMEEVEAL